MTPPPIDVPVWLWFTDQAPTGLQANFGAWLSEDERARVDRLRLDHVRHEYLMTRVLVRQTLSFVEPSVHPSQWRFVRNEHGKPDVAGPVGVGSLRFNVSNTHGLVACCITRDRHVGIDVECRERNSDGLAIADRYFSADEVAALRALPEADQAHRFFEYWTLKEAYIKARGMGLAIPLGQFTFLLDGPGGRNDIGIAFDPRLEDDPARWAFALHSPSTTHQLALAVQTEGRAVSPTLQSFEPQAP